GIGCRAGTPDECLLQRVVLPDVVRNLDRGRGDALVGRAAVRLRRVPRLDALRRAQQRQLHAAGGRVTVRAPVDLRRGAVLLRFLERLRQRAPACPGRVPGGYLRLVVALVVVHARDRDDYADDHDDRDDRPVTLERLRASAASLRTVRVGRPAAALVG